MVSLRKLVGDERSSIGTGAALAGSLLVGLLSLGAIGLLDGARDLHHRASRGSISADLLGATSSQPRA